LAPLKPTWFDSNETQTEPNLNPSPAAMALWYHGVIVEAPGGFTEPECEGVS